MSQIESRPSLNWLSIIVLGGTFLCAIIGVPWYAMNHDFSLAAWLLFVFFLGANGMSITAGYHRLWAHRTYTAHWLVRVPLMIFGAMALQNSILVWASNHRDHHNNVDDLDKDPYCAKRGFWFSHIGWMFRNYPSAQTDFSNVKDVAADPVAMFQHKHYVPLTLLTNFGFTFLAGWLVDDFWGVFWLSGMARLVVSHHFTWFINSLAHMWGARPYTDDNSARDNGFIAFFTHGEGYHNFHHLYASDYRNGVRWWQWDPTKWMIYGLSLVGLTQNLRRIPDITIQQARVKTQLKRLEQKLSCPKTTAGLDIERLRTQIAHEAEAFQQVMAEWAKARDAWYERTREKLTKGLDAHHFRAQSRQVLSNLRLQHRRLTTLQAEFA